MKDVLIAGCSFVDALTDINYIRVDKFGSCAASNASIAARVIHQLSLQEYKKVIVIWTGINRLSIPVDIELHNVYQLARNPYMFYDVQDPVVWYHSGGILGTEYHNNTPAFIKNYFATQYKSISPRYLTTQTLLNIIAVQSYLENKKIDYEMNFIYDIHKDYSNLRSEYSLGQIDVKSPLYNLVNWNRINQCPSLYEWAVQHGKLGDDQWHITSKGLVDWCSVNLGVDLLS